MKTLRRPFNILGILIMIAIALSACAPAKVVTEAPKTPEVTSAPVTSKEIILATTTSTQDSGLLDVLVPAFQNQSGLTVKTVAVGSGQALKMGEDCNADVLLVHAPSSEKDLMDKGFCSERLLVMHNDFIIVGPPEDPAGIKGTGTAAEAFKKIATTQALFISRGDDSGTHKMELGLWKIAETTPEGAWYQESGQGMGATLKIASEKQAYTLTDRATYLANKDSLGLDILMEGDTALLNVYHVIVVNPDKCPKVNVDGAQAFAKFLTSAEGQKMIGEFGVDKYGQQLFIPDADKTDADLGLK